MTWTMCPYSGAVLVAGWGPVAAGRCGVCRCRCVCRLVPSLLSALCARHAGVGCPSLGGRAEGQDVTVSVRLD
jgi:hypothetical protein